MTVIHTTGAPPTKAHGTDAAFDLESTEGVYLPVGGMPKLVKCGFSIAIPEGHVGLICSRSGQALKEGVFVLNAPGVIDPGYRGEVGVILSNLGEFHTYIEPGDRIAQLLIVPTSNVQLVESATDISLVYPSERDKGGFGSTGKAA